MDTTEAVARAVVLSVSELPDRTSPDDWPDAMLVTAEELTDAVTTAITAYEAHRGLSPLERELAAGLERLFEAQKARNAWDDRDTTNAFDEMLMECEYAEMQACAAIAKAKALENGDA